MAEMITPVFLDNLPNSDQVAAPGKNTYRIQRNKALVELLLDYPDNWNERPCPACGSAKIGRSFSLAMLPFERCAECETIYSSRVPDQATLDYQRLSQPLRELERDDLPVVPNLRNEEFSSLINWMTLTAARTGDSIERVLDFRFADHSPGWRQMIAERIPRQDWTFEVIVPPKERAALEALASNLKKTNPDAVTVFSEIDRCADPAGIMQVIHNNTKPGTLLFIATSCADGLEYELLGSDSPSFVPLDRLNLFSVKGLRGLAEKIGFEALEMSTPGRLDAVILQRYFTSIHETGTPFWGAFFRDANQDRLQDLQTLLQRSLRSGVMRLVLRRQ